MKNQMTFLALFALLVSAAAMADTCPDFSGTYDSCLTDGKPVPMKTMVTQTKDDRSVSKIDLEMNDGQFDLVYHLTSDGQEHANEFTIGGSTFKMYITTTCSDKAATLIARQDGTQELQKATMYKDANGNLELDSYQKADDASPASKMVCMKKQ